MFVQLDPRVESAVREHASRSYPVEACGLLAAPRPRGSQPSRVLEVVDHWPARNLEHSTSGFLVDPVDLARADTTWRRRGLRLCGCYHSHPDLPARPSQADRQAAWPEMLQLMLSLRRGLALELMELKAYWPEGGQLRAIPLAGSPRNPRSPRVPPRRSGRPWDR